MTLTLHIRQVDAWTIGPKSLYIIESVETIGDGYKPYVLRTTSPDIAKACREARDAKTPKTFDVEALSRGWFIRRLAA